MVVSPEIFDRMRKKASKTNATYKVVAFSVKHGKVVCCTPIARYYRRGGGIHSEQLAMKKMPDMRVLILARFNTSGELLPIGPCSRCQRHAKRMGVKIIICK